MNPFKIGMKLEAEDTKNTNRLCVSTIGDVIDNRVLITLDGLDSCYNYWCHITSPYIHPVNFHQENGWSISSPPGKCHTINCFGYLTMSFLNFAMYKMGYLK